jgi:hypothetical protein
MNQPIYALSCFSEGPFLIVFIEIAINNFEKEISLTTT